MIELSQWMGTRNPLNCPTPLYLSNYSLIFGKINLKQTKNEVAKSVSEEVRSGVVLYWNDRESPLGKSLKELQN